MVCRYFRVRITVYSWLLILAGGALFGLGLIGVARVLPSGDASSAAVVVVDSGLDAAGDAEPPAAPVRGQPPLSRVEWPTSGEGPRMLDLRVVDESLRDRNGNAPKRALAVDELRIIAAAYDVVADDLTQQPDGAALTPEDIAMMHTVNPRLRVVRVLETLTSNDPTYAGIRPDDGSHSAWFPRDAAGQPVLVYEGNAAWNRQPNFLMNSAVADVQIAIAARARQFVRLGYDGVLLHGVSAGVPAAASATPVDPSTKQAYIDAGWAAGVAAMITEVARISAGAVFVDTTDPETAALTVSLGATPVVATAP